MRMIENRLFVEALPVCKGVVQIFHAEVKDILGHVLWDAVP